MSGRYSKAGDHHREKHRPWNTTDNIPFVKLIVALYLRQQLDCIQFIFYQICEIKYRTDYICFLSKVVKNIRSRECNRGFYSALAYFPVRSTLKDDHEIDVLLRF